MSNFKEIVTKAVIAKGKKTFVSNYTMTPEIEPTTILGCWIINHNFKGEKIGDSIRITGSYDVNIWYSCLNDTKTEVVRQTNTYTEELNLPVANTDINTNEEVIVRSLSQPNCVKAEIKDGNMNYTVEQELGVELVGDTKIKIAIDDDEEPWQDLTEKVITDAKEIEKQIDNEVKEDFLDN